MSIDSKLIGAAMLTDIDRDLIDTASTIHAYVVNQIFCPITSKVLDSRTAQLVTLEISESVTKGVTIGKRAQRAVHSSVTLEQLRNNVADSASVAVVSLEPAAPIWAAINKALR